MSNRLVYPSKTRSGVVGSRHQRHTMTSSASVCRTVALDSLEIGTLSERDRKSIMDFREKGEVAVEAGLPSQATSLHIHQVQWRGRIYLASRIP
ncbi:hypothetical protein AC628_05905 [Bradyrhizobium sp. NAS96.2]|nr:hypothetical protein AC628_05905 [Bradyrhizobium sp. NAS96.2]